MPEHNATVCRHQTLRFAVSLRYSLATGRSRRPRGAGFGRGRASPLWLRQGRIPAKTRIFKLKFQLATIRPPVWRRVLVPGEIDLGELHAVIQAAFGWTNSHLLQFEISEHRYGTLDPGLGPGRRQGRITVEVVPAGRRRQPRARRRAAGPGPPAIQRASRAETSLLTGDAVM
ncbi:MAG: plasmid pRiA4b ORF-3 family protein [Nocardioidaceae bacterium]